MCEGGRDEIILGLHASTAYLSEKNEQAGLPFLERFDTSLEKKEKHEVLYSHS